MNTPDLQWSFIRCPEIQLGESPRWAHGQLRWVDIPGRRMYSINNWNQAQTTSPKGVSLPDEIGCIVPSKDPGRWLGLGRQGLWQLNDDQAPQLAQAGPFDPALQRFNDGRADPSGRIWVSTLVDARSPANASLYFHSDQQWTEAINGITVGNGLAFAPDQRHVYLADTTARCVWRFAFDVDTGQLSERQLFTQYLDGKARPDGAAMSEDGHYWVAVFEGQRIDRWSPDGHLVQSYPTPMLCPTMPCFAGPQRRTLVVTSAGLSRPEAERSGTPAGDVALLEVDVPGLPEYLAERLTAPL